MTAEQPQDGVLLCLSGRCLVTVSQSYSTMFNALKDILIQEIALSVLINNT